MNKLPFEAIIFDHDGTLVDTEIADFLACKMLFDELGASLTLDTWANEVIGHANGYEIILTQLIKQHAQQLSIEVLLKRVKELWAITQSEIKLTAGVTELLPQLQRVGYPLAVASASNYNWVSRWLDQFNLRSYFSVIATRDDVSHSKPAPDVYLFAADQLGVQPNRCLVFEDSIVGLQAARAAGMVVVAVPTQLTKVSDFSQANIIIDSLQAVTLEWLEQVCQV